ncbi:MAG TPA: histidine phosphatase family protein [Bacteroidales bacterium]|jgi:Phosphohistidine phosphatase SixA
MSKTLVIIRHGKSTWEYTGVPDYDRPLKETGIINTRVIALKLMEQDISPDLIVSSPANRALHTALIVARELSYPLEKISISPVLYGESENAILDMVRHTSDQFNTLFIFGHNPVFTVLPNLYLKQTIDNLPTSGVVILEFDTSHWSDISRKLLKSEFLLSPKGG